LYPETTSNEKFIVYHDVQCWLTRELYSDIRPNNAVHVAKSRNFVIYLICNNIY
jgi:hypothetical protein